MYASYVPFQRSQHREQSRRRADRKKKQEYDYLGLILINMYKDFNKSRTQAYWPALPPLCKVWPLFYNHQQLVRHLKSHAVWLARIACRDDQLAGPCMVLWEELIIGLLFSFSIVVIISSSRNTMHGPASWSSPHAILASQTAWYLRWRTSCSPF